MNEQTVTLEKVEPKFKMTLLEVVEQLKAYTTQAEQSLTQIQASIDKGLQQINDWRQMALKLQGHHQVAKDLLNKIIEQPTETTANK